MAISMTDRNAMLELGKRYAEIAASPRQEETMEGWRRLNALQETRPMVRIEQLPWHELPWGGEQMVCQEPWLRAIESRMRMTIYSWENFKSDMVVLPYLELSKEVQNSQIGPQAKVERIGLSQHYSEQLNTQKEIEELQTPLVKVDPELDCRRLEMLSELFDGVLPVKLTGHIRHSGLWDRITTCISPERVLYDLIDRPEYVEALVGKFVEMEHGVLDQFEELGLLQAAPADIHCTGAFSDELPSADYDGESAKAKDTWTFAMSQIFSEVSPAMHEIYEIDPMKSLLERYGLVYYGCCEPLHHKIDIIRKISTVRKISVSPWADKEVAADHIHGDYVFSSKPNPSYVAMESFDEDLVRKDLKETADICKRYNTPCELILKDVSTVCNEPQRLVEWERIAMEVVQG
jgi:hypothetical protein